MTGHQTLLVLLVELALLVDLALRPTGYAGQLLHATLLLELLGLHLLGGLRLLPGRGSRPTLRGDDAADGGRDAHAGAGEDRGGGADRLRTARPGAHERFSWGVLVTALVRVPGAGLWVAGSALAQTSRPSGVRGSGISTSLGAVRRTALDDGARPTSR